MMIVLGHFLIAAAAVIATSAIIGYFLTKLLLRLLQKVDLSIRLYRGKVPTFSAPPRISRRRSQTYQRASPAMEQKKFGLSTQTRLPEKSRDIEKGPVKVLVIVAQ